MNLGYLITYIEVIKRGSFSEVAAKLSISQPAVSLQIQKLERDLGVRLIDRSQKVMTMTEAGKRLLIFARSIDKEWSRLQLDLDRLREEVTGELIIAASSIPGNFLLPSLLAEFRSLHPTVRVRALISDSVDVAAKVREGIYDVGCCGFLTEGQELESLKIGQDEIVLIVFPEHPFARRKAITLKDLEGETIIFREETSGTQRTLEALLSQAGFHIKTQSPGLVLSTTQAMVSAVEARAGIAFISNLAIKESLALGLVKQVPVKGLKLNRDFYCVYRRERIVSRLLEEFIAFVQAKGKG